MQLPRLTKPIAIVVLLVGLFLYLSLIDLGVNAGRVHYGVTVSGYEIGGHTFPETVALLNDYGKQLQRTPIVLGAEGFDCRFTPKEIGWGPQPANTAELAMGIGRPLGAFDSIKERIEAWLQGTTVQWADRPDEARVDELADRCEQSARSLGRTIDRAGLERVIARSVTLWPRPIVVPVPFTDEAG